MTLLFNRPAVEIQDNGSCLRKGQATQGLYQVRSTILDQIPRQPSLVNKGSSTH